MKVLAAMFLGGSLIAAPSSAYAKDAFGVSPSDIAFNIGAGSLKRALDLFRQQTNSQLIYRTSDAANLQSSGASGVMSREAAIGAILAHTGLEARYDRSGALAIVRSRTVTPASVLPSEGQRLSVEPAAQTSAPAETGLGDIIVTAQKRSERLQNVPVAVTALAGQALQDANITDTKSLSVAVPSLNFTQAASFAQPFIRGVGSRGNTSADEQIVPIYIDGVYQIGMTAGIFKLNSIDRIEVLRGPQGTLFGRNAVGGAINIVTRDPSLAATAVEVGLGYGRFNEFKGDFYASVPLSDTVAANLSVMRQQDDGYSRDVLRKTDEAASYTTSVRAKLLWKPSAALTAKLNGFYLAAGDAGGVASFPLNGSTGALRVDPTVFIGRDYAISNSFSPYAKTKAYGGSTDLTFDAGIATLSSLSSYAYFRSEFATDNDATASTSASPLANSRFLGVDQHYTFTQELRAASNGEGPIHWLAGGFYLHDLLKNPAGFFINVPGLSVENRGSTKSYALFGELQYDFTPNLSIKAALRYSKEFRKADTFDFLASKRITENRNWDDLSPRVTIDYKIANGQRIYFTYSEAFKSGVIIEPVTTASISFVNVVDPEKLKSFEIGYKGDITSNFRANLSGYYYDYKNVQVTGQGVLPSGAIFSFLQNAAKEHIYGIDADFTYAPSHDLTMGLAISWLHARYASFPNASIQVPRPDGLGNVAKTVDVGGYQVQRAPTFTGGFNASYAIPQPVFGGKLRLSGNISYNSGWAFDFISRVTTGEYVDLNGRATWTSGDDHYSVSLWGSNLTNNHRLLSVSESGGADRGSRVRPISYGVETRFKF